MRWVREGLARLLDQWLDSLGPGLPAGENVSGAVCDLMPVLTLNYADLETLCHGQAVRN